MRKLDLLWMFRMGQKGEPDASQILCSVSEHIVSAAQMKIKCVIDRNFRTVGRGWADYTPCFPC